MFSPFDLIRLLNSIHGVEIDVSKIGHSSIGISEPSAAKQFIFLSHILRGESLDLATTSAMIESWLEGDDGFGTDMINKNRDHFVDAAIDLLATLLVLAENKSADQD